VVVGNPCPTFPHALLSGLTCIPCIPCMSRHDVLPLLRGGQVVDGPRGRNSVRGFTSVFRYRRRAAGCGSASRVLTSVASDRAVSPTPACAKSVP
jgi:hypothetical protein